MVKKIRHAFTRTGLSRHTASKLASLLFAIVLWIFVMDIENPEIVKTIEDISIEYINEESIKENGLLLTDVLDSSVDIKVRGRRSEVLNINKNDFNVTVDLYGSLKGDNSKPINARILKEDVYIESMSQMNVKLYLDKVVEVPKLVEVQVVGTLPSSYQKGKLDFQPSQVIVRGPEKLVNKVFKLTGELDVDKMQNDISKQIALLPVDNDGNVVSGVTLNLNYINAEIPIYKLKKVNIYKNYFGEAAEGYKITDVDLTQGSVYIRGAEDYVDKVQSLQISKLDLSGVDKSQIIIAELLKPSGVVFLDLDEGFGLDVKVEKVISLDVNVNSDDISILNLNADYKSVLEEQEIIVKLRGIESVIKSFRKQDLNISVDLSNLEIGKHEVPVRITTLKDLEEMIVDIENIEVTIEEKTNGETDDSTAEGVEDATDGDSTSEDATGSEEVDSNDSTGENN